jgi:RNA polymerase sigma-70 factor (ECF subfamily)
MFSYMPRDHDQSLLDDAGDLTEEALRELDAHMRAGEQEALAQVFTACRDRLRQVITFRLDDRLRNRIDPDDVLQEAFLAASQRLGHYAGSSYTSPFLWLRAILSQTMVELYRRHIGAQKRNPDQEVRIDAAPFPQATSTSLAIQLVGSATSPGERVARSDIMGMVERAIESMGPLDQEVLALRHFEELSNREVAEVLGIEQKAASIRYVRAIRRLRDVLAQMTAYFRNPR